jgi:hypothetical protein
MGTYIPVERKHTYWSSVATSGWVDVDWASREDAPTVLPPGTRATLKHIDEYGDAFLYRTDLGVLRVPSHTLEAWHR